MARENKYFSLTNASEVAQLHRPEVTLPGVRKAKNFYVSRSDNNLTLRGDMFRYRDDIYTIRPRWQVDTDTVNDDDYLNTVITTGNIENDIFINRLSPMRAGSSVPICSTYTTGTITTDGSTSTVTGVGTYWLQNAWPHAFIEFYGSTDLYRISRIDSNTILIVEGTPPALSGVTYTIYRVHDSDRALYSIHFEMFGQQYLYSATEPNEPDATDQISTSGPFYLKRQDAASPVVIGVPIQPFRSEYTRCKYLNSKFWLVGRNAILESTAGTLWIDRTFQPGADFVLYDIAWSGTTYMAVGYRSPGVYINPLIVTSTDGINWSVLNSTGYVNPSLEINYSIAYGSSKFVITSGHGIYTTTDGVTLTQRTNPLSAYITEVIFENSLFVGFAPGSGIITSADGITWTVRAGAVTAVGSPGTSVWDGTSYLSAGNTSNFIRTQASTNGITWAAGTQTVYTGFGQSIAYNSTGPVYAMSAYITSLNTGYLFSSADGVTWIYRKALDAYTYVTALACDNTTFVAATGSGKIYTSTDAVTWTEIGPTSLTTIVGSYLDEVTTTSEIATTTERHLWFLGNGGALIKHATHSGLRILIGTGLNTTWRDMARCADRLVAVGDGGYAATSGDGIVWTQQTSNSPANADLNGIIYNSAGPLLVAVGDAGAIVTSPDGVTWTDRSDAGMTKNLFGVAWNGTVYIAVGADGKIQSSTDGISWTDRTPGGETEQFNGVYSTTSLAVSIGNGGMIYTSTNGTSWTERTSGTAVNLTAITLSGNRWMAAGASGVVRSSTDGITWSAVTTNATSDFTTIVYDGLTYTYASYDRTMVRIPPAITDAVFYPISESYRSGAMAVVGGYVLLLGTSEWASNNWTYWPRRVRWTSPGTFQDFVGYASGAQDLPGSGYIIDARTLQNNVILFESQRIGVYSFTGDIELPFLYRVISEGIFPISNPVIVDDLCYFINGQGLLYATNGVTVDKAPGLFDLTEYVDIHAGHPVFLSFNRYTRSLLVYMYDSTATEHICFTINPESGAYTSILLNQPTSANPPRSLVEFVTAYAPIAQDPGIPHDGGDGTDVPTGAPIYIDIAIIGSAQSGTSIVVVDRDGYVYRTTDGTSWNRQLLDNSNVILNGGIVYDDTLTEYIVCGQSSGVTGGDGPCVWHSVDDGLTWIQSLAVVASKDGRSVYSIGGVCVIGTDDGYSYSTTDFSSWTLGTTGIEDVTSIDRIYYDTNWVAATGDNRLLYSAAGIVWSEASIDSTPAHAVFRFASHGGNIYAAENGTTTDLLVSDDGGETWTTFTITDYGTMLNKVYSFGGTYMYLFGGDTSATSGIAYSSDASTWAFTNSNLFDPNRSGSSNGGLHGYEGLIRFALDGKTYIFGDKWTT